MQESLLRVKLKHIREIKRRSRSRSAEMRKRRDKKSFKGSFKEADIEESFCYIVTGLRKAFYAILAYIMELDIQPIIFSPTIK